MNRSSCNPTCCSRRPSFNSLSEQSFRAARGGLVLWAFAAVSACSSDGPAVVLPTVDLRPSPSTADEAGGAKQPGSTGPNAGAGGNTQASPRTGSSTARPSGEPSSSAQQTQSSSVSTNAGSTASTSGVTTTGSTASTSGVTTTGSTASTSGVTTTGNTASTDATTTTSSSTSLDTSSESSASTKTDDTSSGASGESGGGSSGEGSSSDGSTAEAKTCLPLCDKGTKDAFVDCVVEFKPAAETAHYVEEYEVTDPETGEKVTKTREYFGWNHDKMPGIVLGPPGGVFDTVSLGCEGSLTVGFVDPPLVDGPGPDLIVFENPFAEIFPEPVRVEVSDDACTWVEFPCNPVTLQGCGGVSVVKALPGQGIDPTDPELAGGDAFDLADIGVQRARFVRVISVSREYWLAKENTEKWCDPGPMTTGKGGSDIDAFALVHAPAQAPQ